MSQATTLSVREPRILPWVAKLTENEPLQPTVAVLTVLGVTEVCGS